MKAQFTFRIAKEDWEIEQIHRLNYKTFVEEIPQHPAGPAARLVDKFHSENTYAICIVNERVVGMVAGRCQRPFSLDHKLPNLDSHLPLGRTPVEIRLLAVERDHRTGRVFCGLVQLIASTFQQRGCNLALISGTVRQAKLYSHLGFVPFGPLVGTGSALFQPMYLTLEDFERNLPSITRGTTGPS